MKQWRKIYREGDGWQFIATVDRSIGLGVIWHGRFNGWSIYLGPLVFDIQPPLPAGVTFTKEN